MGVEERCDPTIANKQSAIVGHPRDSRLSVVNFAAMANAGNFDHELLVIDGVYDAVIADTNAPLAVSAVEFLTARRAGIRGQKFQARKDSCDQGRRELFQIP